MLKNGDFSSLEEVLGMPTSISCDFQKNLTEEELTKKPYLLATVPTQDDVVILKQETEEVNGFYLIQLIALFESLMAIGAVEYDHRYKEILDVYAIESAKSGYNIAKSNSKTLKRNIKELKENYSSLYS